MSSYLYFNAKIAKRLIGLTHTHKKGLAHTYTLTLGLAKRMLDLAKRMPDALYTMTLPMKMEKDYWTIYMQESRLHIP